MKRFFIAATATMVLVVGALAFVAISPTTSASAQTDTATTVPGAGIGYGPGIHRVGDLPDGFENGQGPRGDGLRATGQGQGPRGLFDSELLADIDPAELREAIQNGTIGDLVDIDALLAEHLAEATARLDTLVADGVLTEEEAAEHLSEIEDHMAALANGEIEFGSGPGFGLGLCDGHGDGPRQGPGPGNRGPRGGPGNGIHTPGTGLAS